MGTLVTYELTDSVATIAMDDGKANAISLTMIAEINEALDQAVTDSAVVVLHGRERIFSAGFDLRVLTAGGADAAAMLNGGFELSERLLSFPAPVVVACTGHAMAMGLFLLLSGDYRIGIAGPFKLAANEVAIGMTMPRAPIEIMRQRLTPAALTRTVALAETFTPESAVAAGLLDQVVEASELDTAARTMAVALSALNPRAHTLSKLRVRGPMLTALRSAIEADDAEFRHQAARR